MTEIRGVYVANVTPFRPDGEVDVEAYIAHVAWLAEKGVQGVVTFGSNGEGPLLSLREKVHILEALLKRGVAIQVIPTVAQGNLPETLEMVRVLNDFPLTAIMVLPAYYFRSVTAEGIRRFLEPVVEVSRHPVILYHIPDRAVPIPIEVVASLPVWGVKDSGGESTYTRAVLAAGRQVLLGTERDLWERLRSGAAGMISALANFVPERVLAAYTSIVQGEETLGKTLAAQLQSVRAMVKHYPSIAALKKLAEARHGIPMGTVRPPLSPVPSGFDPHPILAAAGVQPEVI